MSTRREFLRTGLAALGLGFSGGGHRLQAHVGARRSPIVDGSSSPIRQLHGPLTSTLVQGLPFEPWFTGDDFPDPQSIPFHTVYQGPIPAATEEVPVAIVGGGLSGLTTGYLLRRYRPVILELHERFGGNAQGERGHGVHYSLGSAYFITPDPGTFLYRLYHRLGLHLVKRESFPPDPIELENKVLDEYWSGLGLPAEEEDAMVRYAQVVTHMAENAYPEIPLSKDPAAAKWVRELDRRSFREDVEDRMDRPLTPYLASAIQAYFYSSFGAGMEDISAAAGWNFVAAEEFGRWVLPGGNSTIAQALWKKLRQKEQHGGSGAWPMLRSGCTVVDVRKVGRRFQVTWLDSSGTPRSLAAEYVVMAGSKHICKYMIHELAQRDPEKLAAMKEVATSAYVVANVLLNTPVERDFYDLFLVRDTAFPMTPSAFEVGSRPVDVVDGSFALPATAPRSSLTFYWPLPWFTARFTLLIDEPFERYSNALVGPLRDALKVLKVPESAVRQIRLTRWGHAMPIAKPGFIYNGYAETLLRPFDERVYFANQDNWALPAVENSLLDARFVAREIKQRLG